MNIIKRRRLELKLSLQKLADLTGVPRSTLWEIENGLTLPDPQAAARIRQVLELPGLPDNSQLLGPKTIQPTRPFDWARPNQTVWQRMEKIFAYELRRLNLPPHLVQWMKECLTNDSPLECLALCSLAADGATGQFSSPHQLGFRRQCIIDQEGRALGERLMAGLSWRVENQTALIWPQVRMLTPQGYWQPDLLIGVAGRWPTAELDGKDHCPDRDRYRDLSLGQASLRISNDEVRKFQFVPKLREYLLELLNLKNSAA